MKPIPPYGIHGAVLRIDLTRSSHEIIHPPARDYELFIGGRGLAGRFLFPHAGKAWDAPDMPLLLFAGPLVGTAAPCACRTSVMSRSPLTGALAEADAGGRLGTEIKRSGLDGIIITGRAPYPVTVRIADHRVSIEPAGYLQNATTTRIFDTVNAPGAMLAIGPAAWQGVRFASLCVDRFHAAGRTGLGLCAAAKNLACLTVHGSGRVAVADPSGLAVAREEILRLCAASPVLMGPNGFHAFGTAALYDLIHTRRMMPTDNFRSTRFAGAPRMNAAALANYYALSPAGCDSCPVRCLHIDKSSGRVMPDYDAMAHFSAGIGNNDLELMTRANALCYELGMDPVSAASALACHAEIEERALKPDEVLRLLEDMAHARCAGAALGQGSRVYAADRGRPELSMSVKGLELPAYDPRGAYGIALSYAVSTRGGCHLRGGCLSHEILRKPVATDRFSLSGKARIVKIGEDATATMDALSVCKSVFLAASLEEYGKAFVAVTGASPEANELLRCGARIDYQERLMNACWGFDARHDALPPRFFNEPGTGGDGLDIPPLERDAFNAALQRYYRVRGLTPQGRPTPESAHALELEWPPALGRE